MEQARDGKLNRRTFLKRAGIGAAVGGVSVAVAGVAVGKAHSAHRTLAKTSIGQCEPLADSTCPDSEAIVEDFRGLNINRMSDLDRLPWFTKDDDGALRLDASAGLPPIIDVHAHLGWAFGLGKDIDMTATSPVEYFYDYEVEEPFLFLQNHPSAEESKELSGEMAETFFRTPERNRTHTAANVAAEMDRMGCVNMAMLPIAVPAFAGHTDQTFAGCAHDPRLIPFGAIHPYPWGPKKERELERQMAERQIKAIKLHPEFQFIAPEERHCMRLFEWCAHNDVLILTHAGYTGAEPKILRDKAEPERFIPAMEAFPKLRMIFAHTGVRRIDETIAVVRQFEDRAWVDISGQPANNIAYILARLSTERILYGSDWPFMPLPVMIARMLVASEGCPDLRQRLFHDNAADVLGLA